MKTCNVPTRWSGFSLGPLLQPINILTGSSRIRTLIDSDADWSEVDHAIEAGVDKFRLQCERYLLY